MWLHLSSIWYLRLEQERFRCIYRIDYMSVFTRLRGWEWWKGMGWEWCREELIIHGWVVVDCERSPFVGGWASALTRRGGGLVWDEELWCEGEAWTIASSLLAVQVCLSVSPVLQEKQSVLMLKHQGPWLAVSHSLLSLNIPTICLSSAPHKMPASHPYPWKVLSLF